MIWFIVGNVTGALAGILAVGYRLGSLSRRGLIGITQKGELFLKTP